MKKISLILAAVMLLIAFSAVLTACNNDYDTFKLYYFNDDKGEFTARPREQITVSKDREYLYVKKDGSTTGKDITIDGRRVLVGDKLEFYASEYFIAPVSSMKGHAVVDDDFNGEMTFENVIYSLDGGVITSQRGEIVGDYSVKNNYVTIALDGARREYMFMRIVHADGETKTVGLFDEFYSMISVLADKVENTGFTLNKTVLLVNGDDTLTLTPKTKNYKFKDVRFEVVKADGYDLKIEEDGKYTLKITKKSPSDNIRLKVTADGLTKTFDFLPVSVAYDKSLMVMRFVGDSIDFDNKLWYLYDNIDPKEVSIKTVVVLGEENCELNNNVITFTESGVVVVRMVATFKIGEDVYVLTDEASINISDKYVNELQRNKNS